MKLLVSFIACVILLPAGCSMSSRRGEGDVNATDVLYSSIERNDYVTARRAIHAGADLGGSGSGSTPLMIAARAGALEIVKLIVNERPDVNIDDGEGRTALWWAAQTCRADVARFLVEKGADVNVRDPNNTALMNAAQEGCVDTARLLLDRGARVNERNGIYTALVLAAWYCRTDIRDREGKTALMHARERKDENIIRLLRGR